MKKFFLLFLFLLSEYFLLDVFSDNVITRSSRSQWVDSTLNLMSLDEKIGQLFMVAAYSTGNTVAEDRLEEQIRKYHLGGLIFFQGDPARQVKLVNRYQKVSKYPLLIGLDAEHGVGWRLKTGMEFPKMCTIGAIQDDSLIFVLGKTIARHCKELGVHVNFAPVVDINSNPLNPIIGVRSFGEIPEKVAQRAILYMKGSLAGGVLPVAKHFPGHGDTDADSHKALPIVSRSRSHLDSVELYPYRAMIEAGLPAVMVSHLNVPALDTSGIPTSLSERTVNGLLKKELGFHGICFTDAMNMKGVLLQTPCGEAEVKALLAGNHVLLFPENVEKAVQSIKKAVQEGVVDECVIDNACRKILTCKYDYVLHHILTSQKPGLWSRINTAGDFALKQKLYRAAQTLVKNRDSLLPLKRLDTLKIASLNFGGDKVNSFQTELQHYTQVRNFVVKGKLSDEELQEWKNKLLQYNCIIIYNQCAKNYVSGKFGYSSSLSKLIELLHDKRIILCHPAIPYGLKNYMDLKMDAVSVSYDHHLYAQKYAAQAIFGGIGYQGKLPVSVNKDYVAEMGIITKKTRLSYESPESEGLPPTVFKPIDSICEKAVSIKATPGCQVLVAYKGKVIYNKAFGYHTYMKKKKNGNNDIYDIASVTKITATLPALMKLYDDKLIELDKPLSCYYSDLLHTDKKDMTVREVLCHNAGLKASVMIFADAIDKKSFQGHLFANKRTPTNTLRLKNNLYVNPNFSYKDSTFSNVPKKGYQYVSKGVYIYPAYKDSVQYYLLNSPLSTAKKYVYSDLGFIYLEKAVEEISGQSISRFCKEGFYSRLGMNNTDYKASERLPQSRIIPSTKDKMYRKTELLGVVNDPLAAILGGVAGHAGLFSTADDLAKIMQMYLNDGEYGGETYLSSETLHAFTSKNRCFRNNRRGLGFDKPEPDTAKPSPVCKEAPLSSFGHAGFTGVLAWCDPDNDLIYIFLSNRTYPDEYDNKLTKENIRSKIHEAIYLGLGIGK